MLGGQKTNLKHKKRKFTCFVSWIEFSPATNLCGADYYSRPRVTRLIWFDYSTTEIRSLMVAKMCDIFSFS